jgi:hypothetical protein
MDTKRPLGRLAFATVLALSLVVPSAVLARPSLAPSAAGPAIPRLAMAPGLRAEFAAGLIPRVLPVVARREDKVKSKPAPVKPAAAKPKAVAKPAPKPAPKPAVYRGKNHVWIPALRVNKSVAFFPCSRTQPPGNYVYRWGCSGSNNVYLMGHAYSVFKPLHDAYVSGRLKKGMKVIYADSKGRVRTYKVVWWRVVRPTTAASWAWAPLARSSMTLQTCVGRNSSHRLMVRLVQV